MNIEVLKFVRHTGSLPARASPRHTTSAPLSSLWAGLPVCSGCVRRIRTRVGADKQGLVKGVTVIFLLLSLFFYSCVFGRLDNPGL